MTLRLGEVNHRWQLGDLMNSRGLLGVAVEVGTHRGVFAESFRRVWQGQTLHCIDPWNVPPGFEQQAAGLGDGSKGDREDDYWTARKRLLYWTRKGQVEIHRAMSPEAAGMFSDESLDLVYIDADHSYSAVLADLEAWWPKLRSGGLIAGHDFLCPGEVAGGWGQFTQRAVAEFSATNGVDTFLIIENGSETAGQPWSYYLEKP
jgi:hypothetical protein